MNNVENTEYDNHHMSPNAQIWGLYRSEEIVKCAYYCGRDATTENVTKYGVDKCCEQCKAEALEADKDYERALEIGRIQGEFIDKLFS